MGDVNTPESVAWDEGYESAVENILDIIDEVRSLDMRETIPIFIQRLKDKIKEECTDR